MAERRMITRHVTDDDEFLSLSSSAQALYLHLSMSADDDGFTRQVSLAMFRAHAGAADLEALLSKRYVYQFENGVIVIRHWRMANVLRKDRYTPTIFQHEMAQLGLNPDKTYTDPNDVNFNGLPDGCQVVANCLPQDRLGKDRLDKDRLIESGKPPRPTLDEVIAYCADRGNKVDAEHFYNYYSSQGWKKANGRPLIDWKAAVVTWEKKEKDYGHSRDSKAGEKPAKEFDIHYDNE